MRYGKISNNSSTVLSNDTGLRLNLLISYKHSKGCYTMHHKT